MIKNPQHKRKNKKVLTKECTRQPAQRSCSIKNILS